ncbi:MAG: hypothetical protein HMLKMBBP_01554 [Planctomycetes bacterium]|nr:hypothetical protein [Planctomycetota bacterium]
MPQETDPTLTQDPALNTAGADPNAGQPGSEAAGDDAGSDTPKSIAELMQEQFGPEPEGKEGEGADPNAQAAGQQGADPNAAAAKGAEAGAQGEQPPPAKPAGADNPLYRIPSGLRGEHRKAYVALVEHAKALDAKATTAESAGRELEQAKGVLSTFNEVIADAKATPDQMAMAFDVIKAINAGDLDRAIGALQGQLTELARMAGKPLPGIDWKDQLREFPDLAEAVANAQITQEHALELAKGRRMQAEQQRQAAESRTQAETAQQWEREKREAMAAVNKYLSEKAKTDIDHQKKEQIVAAKVREIIAGVPPSRWAEKIALFYEGLVLPAAAPAKEQQPLRARTGAGGAPTPKSAEEALRQGLGYPMT